jgi:hypothetical protein
MSEEDFPDRRRPSAPVGHEFETPVVRERPRDAPHFARERGESIDAAQSPTSQDAADRP